MSNGTTGTNDIDIDTIVDNRTALYDQLEAQPYRLLQEEVMELITSTVEAAGRDANDVETALLSDPLDEDWWFSIATEQALNAIVVAGDEGVIRVDIAYELGDERDLNVPGPDALPLLDDGEDLTIYCLLNREADLSATTGNVTVKGREKPPTDTGPVTLTLIGPEGQEKTTELPRDQTIGFVVTDLKQSYDVYDAEIGLYEDKRYSTAIDNSADPGPYDEETVYWQVERRAP